MYYHDFMRTSSISLPLEGSLAQNYTGTQLVPTTQLAVKRNSSVPWFLMSTSFIQISEPFQNGWWLEMTLISR